MSFKLSSSSPSSPSSSAKSMPPNLPPEHPLAAELASLRAQVTQYRAAAHQASISVQGVRLELELAKEESAGLRAKNSILEKEVETLRSTPDPPLTTPPSNALAELSLAHRRLSAKLDFTEQQLSACSLELASTQQELQRVQHRADAERAALAELRRTDDDREEEVHWERSERQRIEEQKKLCDLALAEYAALVSRLDPRAVPPAIPRRHSNDILQDVPALGEAAPPTPPLPKEHEDGADLLTLVDKESEHREPEKQLPPPPESSDDDSDDDDDLIAISGPARKGTQSSEQPDSPIIHAPKSRAESPVKSRPSSQLPSRSASPSMIADEAKAEAAVSSAVTAHADAISNLLIGQRGVHRLFKDFSTSLSTKEKEIRELVRRAEELESDLGLVRGQLTSETSQRVDAQSERDRALRDDASAAKVVERYMTFSQKAHETVHTHLGHLRTRSAATQASLRTEAANLRRRMLSESDRAARLRAAAEEMADELGKESAGRRREVALRLQLIAADEARARRAEQWLDRVRRAREPEAKEALSAPVLGALLDEGHEILSPTPPQPDKPQGWGRRLLARRRSVSKPDNKASGEEESMARVLLAEELVQHLVDDLQIETERRVELEKQRVEWLAKEAEEGVNPEGGDGGGLVFDAEADTKDEGKKADDDQVSEGKAATDEAKAKADDSTSRQSTPPPPHLDDLKAMFDPLVASYSPLQKSLHDQAVSLSSLRANLPELKQGKLRALALRPARTARDDLVSLLDGLYEVIEDARVDAEIAVADEDRVFHGFAALLGVGSGVVQASSVLRDAGEYVSARGAGVPEAEAAADVEDDRELSTTQDGEKDEKNAPEKKKDKTQTQTPLARLTLRVRDIEHDLATIKRTLHEAEGLDAPEEETKERRRKSVWASLVLRTVSPQAAKPLAPAMMSALVESSDDDEPARPPRPSLMSMVGRSFSSSVGVAASNVAGAPRKVSTFAGGFRPRRGTVSEAKVEAKEGEVEDAEGDGVKREEVEVGEGKKEAVEKEEGKKVPEDSGVEHGGEGKAEGKNEENKVEDNKANDNRADKKAENSKADNKADQKDDEVEGELD